MSIVKLFPGVLMLYLVQSTAVVAQAPPADITSPYSREEIDNKIDTIQKQINALQAPYSKAEIDGKIDTVQKEINALQAVNPYSKAEIDGKIDGIRSDLQVLQAVNPYSKTEADAKLGVVEGKIDTLRQIEDSKITTLTESNAIPFWLPVGISIFSALLAAFTWWRTNKDRKVDLALRREDKAIDLVDRWKIQEDLAGKVGGILKNPNCLNDKENGPEYRLQVIKLGNWWNTLATHYRSEDADRAKLKSHDMLKLAKAFWWQLEDARAAVPNDKDLADLEAKWGDLAWLSTQPG
jgi:hypothetical protein